jgi:hypothetical protein
LPRCFCILASTSGAGTRCSLRTLSLVQPTMGHAHRVLNRLLAPGICMRTHARERTRSLK